LWHCRIYLCIFGDVCWLSSKLIGQQGWPGYEAMNAAAAAMPPGCEGLLCCDYFQVGSVTANDMRLFEVLEDRLALAHVCTKAVYDDAAKLDCV
jgi:hypothetical protein